jgi:lipopolysaccharide/colanic/teichoic acid biosynthesis glycosyltransferase
VYQNDKQAIGQNGRQVLFATSSARAVISLSVLIYGSTAVAFVDEPLSYAALKRVLDVAVSLVLIVLFAPIWLMAAMALKLSSPGPILYHQTRGGLGGRPFESYKFRTMRADHRHDPNEIVPLTHDAITRVGKILRRLKIDELPQLFNVLNGDMSLVGPRPTIMEQVLAYDDFRKRRLEVRPGITGLAQVNGNANISWEERIRYDVYYVDHMSIGMDVAILAKTAAVVIAGEERYTRSFEHSPYSTATKKN